MVRLVQADKKKTRTQLTLTIASIKQQKTTTCVQSATKKKLMLQWLHAHQDWTIENWKSISWSLMSFDFGSSTQMVGVKIWQEKTHLLTSLYQQLRHLLLVVERCGEDVFFLAHFVPIKYHLNCSPLRPCCKSYFQPDNAPCHNAYIIPGWFLEHSELAVLKRPLHSPDLNPAEHYCDLVERNNYRNHESDTQKSAPTA